MEKGIAQELRELGLTSYEAKCYISLVRLGPSDVRRVAEDSGVPYPSAYGALDALAAKGWVELVRKRPAKYRARKPIVVKEMVESRMDNAFEALDRVYTEQPAEDAELVYTIRGREKVLSKVYELLNDATRTITLAAPATALEDGKILELVKKALQREVKIRAVSDRAAKEILSTGVQLRTSSLVAVDLLVDDCVALIALPDFSACGWMDSPQVAGHLKQFFELLWSASTPV